MSRLAYSPSTIRYLRCICLLKPKRNVLVDTSRDQHMSKDPGTQTQHANRMPSNNVFVGLKPVMSYVTAIILHLNSGNKEVTVKARGNAISKAVDVVEVARRRFFEGKLVVKEISIGTEVLGQENERRNVSTMEIKLEKKD
jgi:DNA-binding protein